MYSENCHHDRRNDRFRPKCHPELAGLGIEYSWGKAKQFFRRHTDHVAKHLRDNIKEAMGPRQLPLARARKYARKTRSYRRAYAGQKEMAHEDIEKHVKKQSHLGADRLDWAWLMRN